MMGIARKLLQTVRTTGMMDQRGRKPGSAPKPAAPAAAPKPDAPLPERRTERRVAPVKVDRLKPK